MFLLKNLCGIYSTKDSIMTIKSISYSLKERNYENYMGEVVEVLEDVLNQLHDTHYFYKKKEKTLFMFSTSKNLG